MLHVNQNEAQKLLDRLTHQQIQMKEQALKEEKEGKQNEQVLLKYIEPYSKRMSKMKE